jgi:methylation protein EvaC
MNNCLICISPIEPFMSFGKMPIANGFLKKEEFETEYLFDLSVGFCPNCKMVQLMEQPDREKMFHDNYAFFSSTSTRMAAHFKEFANDVMSKYIGFQDPFVVEIGSNDGIMLQHFANARIRHIGIEPSANVAQIAMEKGVNSISKFFDEDLAREIVAKNGQADAFLGANVMCHIPCLHSVVAGIKVLLKPKGVVIFEDPYLMNILEKTSYDQIYDEHAFYFSIASISHLFAQHGLELINIQPQNVHGGSMRYVLAHKGSYDVSSSVIAQKAKEESLGINNRETYEQFRRNVERSRDTLMTMLCNLKKKSKRVVGYAATSKSSTVTNYCGITPELVEFISDTTPIKQGKYSPGAHIPVRSYEEFRARYPDYALLFGWNHGEEIIEKEKAFSSAGGKWIVYVPMVRIL